MVRRDVQKEGKVSVSFWVDKDAADQLEYLAEKGGITRSRLLSNIAEGAAHDLMLLDKLGVVRLAAFYHQVREGIKKKTTEYKDKNIIITDNENYQ